MDDTDQLKTIEDKNKKGPKHRAQVKYAVHVY